MKYEVVAIPDNQTMGTADSLRFIKDKIKVSFSQQTYGTPKKTNSSFQSNTIVLNH